LSQEGHFFTGAKRRKRAILILISFNGSRFNFSSVTPGANEKKSRAPNESKANILRVAMTDCRLLRGPSIRRTEPSETALRAVGAPTLHNPESTTRGAPALCHTLK
jgi:hypothetical protein